ncbi:MAG: outer membrane protein assembly factor BamE [Metallibacterium scheffleri]|jgi:outer membrane protein assembly factor BamE|nr:outer membrane protein assembly factor BamE [Pseudomonadota bacterium]MDE3141125.1 outer membrane protein assembly factor BamE [Pseudomonadota bacterium]
MQTINRTRVIIWAIALASSFALGGCAILYKPDVQQGNLMQQAKVSELKPGMTKRQVITLLGAPSVVSPFDGSRWDYVSTFQHRGEKIQERKLTLIFKNDTLVRTEGNFFAETPQDMLKASKAFQGDYIPSAPKNGGQGADKQSGGG